MKKILWTILFFSLLIFVSLAQAETEWKPTNQAPFKWVASASLSDTSTIPSNDTITYNVYVKNEDGTHETLVHPEVDCCSTTITFPFEGRYYAGVSTLRLTPTGKITESPIVWSDDPTATHGGIVFGYEHYYYAMPPSGLSPQ